MYICEEKNKRGKPEPEWLIQVFLKAQPFKKIYFCGFLLELSPCGQPGWRTNGPPASARGPTFGLAGPGISGKTQKLW